MTRKNKKYQLLISTLLLCFLQMAGIDVYRSEERRVGKEC